MESSKDPRQLPSIILADRLELLSQQQNLAREPHPPRLSHDMLTVKKGNVIEQT